MWLCVAVCSVAELWGAQMQQFTCSLGSDDTRRRRGEFIHPRRACKALRPYPSPRSPAAILEDEEGGGGHEGQRHGLTPTIQNLRFVFVTVLTSHSQDLPTIVNILNFDQLHTPYIYCIYVHIYIYTHASRKNMFVCSKTHSSGHITVFESWFE